MLAKKSRASTCQLPNQPLSASTPSRRDFFGQNLMKIFFFSVCSQASYYSQASEALSDLTNKLGWKKELSDEDCQQQLQQKLAEIKALSIVEDG